MTRASLYVCVCVGWSLCRAGLAGLTLTKQAPSVTHDASVVRDVLPLLMVEPTLHSSAPGVGQGKGEGGREGKRINSDENYTVHVHKKVQKLYLLPTI